jgi:hypothetical protein
MTRNSTIALVAVAVLSGSLGFALWTAPVYADAAKNGQPPVYGKTYGEWSAAWWQWALAGPKGNNAVQDTTGEFCDVDQPKGKVWFLAGTQGLTGVERTCTIPHNRALFYPLVNNGWVDCPPPSTDTTLTDAEVRDIMNFVAGDAACQLKSTLDGVSISSLQIPTVRTQSPKFSATLPPNHIFAGACSPALPPGDSGRMISEGYWVMLPPLSPGTHVLTLHGAACDPMTGDVFFENEVTYTLHVLDPKAKDDDD